MSNEKVRKACAYCGILEGTELILHNDQSITISIQRDHYFPKSKGGWEGDLIWACNLCNQAKSDKVLNSLSPQEAFGGERGAWLARNVKRVISPLRPYDEIPDRETKYEKENSLDNMS